jgi:hypothetical protein
MSENGEPLAMIPTSPTGETPPIPMATADQGREMETIWQMMTMVTPTTGKDSQSLKNSGVNSWLGFGASSHLWMSHAP